MMFNSSRNHSVWLLLLSINFAPLVLAEGNRTLHLTPEQQQKVGVQISKAGSATIRQSVLAPGKIVINNDQIAHVIPRVSGVVRDVRKSTGDRVKNGELLAVIESMEIADASASYFSAEARRKLLEASFKRKELLWKEEIVSKQAYQESLEALALAQVEERSALQKLVAMDMPIAKLKQQSANQSQNLSRYEIRAPFSGQIMERDIVLGEATQPNVPVFVLANLDTVWVELNVYPKDLDRIRIGQQLRVTTANKSAQAKIIYIRPVVNEESRATVVRALLDNKDQHWQPGLFVSGEILAEQTDAPVVVAHDALMSLHNHDVVFVQEGDTFSVRHVITGARDSHWVEILQGLQANEAYVSAGAFVLKSELEKNQFAEE